MMLVMWSGIGIVIVIVPGMLLIVIMPGLVMINMFDAMHKICLALLPSIAVPPPKYAHHPTL